MMTESITKALCAFAYHNGCSALQPWCLRGLSLPRWIQLRCGWVQAAAEQNTTTTGHLRTVANFDETNQIEAILEDRLGKKNNNNNNYVPADGSRPWHRECIL